jgi:hypothetical protein
MRRLLIQLATVALLPAAALAQNAAPLAPYAGVKVAVVPVQFFKGDSSFATPVGPVLRAQFDTLLSTALEEHGLKGMWATPAEVIRAGRRNITYAGDPSNLGAFSVRNGVQKKEAQVPDPLASSLRRVAALHDARYVLLPAELFVVPGKGSASIAVRLILIDTRLNQPLWQAELVGEPAAKFSPALLLKLATRVAELAVAP